MKILRLIIVLWAFTVAGVLAMTAPRSLATTVLVVPARYSVLQVGFDVSDRMGAALVAYQGDAKTEMPVVDLWVGQEWKRLSLEEYRQATFVGGRVARFIVVGTEEILPEVLVTSVSEWCGDVRLITSLDTPGLVNALGRAFDFTRSDWEWFARRYNLKLADRNAERRRQSWYDRDYYDDEWAHRWQWLRRKYNPSYEQPYYEQPTSNITSPAESVPPAQSVEPAPVEATPAVEPLTPATDGAEVQQPTEETSIQEDEKAQMGPEPAMEPTQTDSEPTEAEQEEETAAPAAASSDVEAEISEPAPANAPGDAIESPEPEEEAWPVK